MWQPFLVPNMVQYKMKPNFGKAIGMMDCLLWMVMPKFRIGMKNERWVRVGLMLVISSTLGDRNNGQT